MDLYSNGGPSGGLSIGPSLLVQLREWLVLRGGGALPFSGRWSAVRFGEHTWMTAQGTAAFGMRLGRGPWTVRLESGVGVGLQTTLVADDPSNLRSTQTIEGLLGGGVTVRGIGLQGWTTLGSTPRLNLLVRVSWPGRIGVF